MSVIVAEGKVVIEADSTKVPGQIAKDIEGGSSNYAAAGKGVGKSVFGGVIGAWAAIGGAQAVTSWFSGAIGGASDLNETLNKTEAIFGKQTPVITGWAKNAAKNVGLSQSAALAAAAGFGDMFTQIGFTGDAAATMSTSVVQAAADLGSFSNLETADVADRISAAFRGEYDSLQKVIPNINAARVESEALAMTGKTVASELTAQEKAAAVLAIVQKDGAKAMGDFAKTSDGAANASKIATASLEDQQAALGAQLLPVWQGFLGFLNDTAIPAFSTLVEWIGKNSDTVLALTAVVAGTAVAFGLATVAGTLYKGFQIASAAATGGLTVAQWALNAAMTANPIGLIIVAIGALVAAIVWVATQTTFFQDTWANVTSFIGTAWTWLWDNVLNPVFTWIGEAFTNIGAVFTWVYESIILPVITGIMIYVGLWAALFTWLYGAIIAPVFAAIGAIFTWIWSSIIMPIVGFISGAINAVGAVFTWLWTNAVSPAFQALGTGFNWVWNSVVNPIIKFITGAINTVGSTVSGVFGGISGFIGSAFQSVLGAIRGPINAIISLVNSAIRGLNSLSVTIPAWVPIVGGQTWGLKLPTIPMLAKGSNSSPDTFIAGENGPELITGARGSTVRPYSVTKDLLAGGGGGTTVHVASVTIDAHNVKDFTDVVEMLKSLPQVARSGQGMKVRMA